MNLSQMLATFLHRPYVFAFLIAFLVIAYLHWGWRRTILWLVISYVIAWASEFSSIHNGFPYGLYHYVYENMPGELMLAGVPVWDSLSYAFLTYAGYTTAEFLICPAICHSEQRSVRLGRTGRSEESPIATNGDPSSRHSSGLRMTAQQQDSKTIYVVVLGALLTMLLDIIIDPVATMGDKWFLGRIHYYEHPGWYFGVPISNFLGWFLVPLATIAIFRIAHCALRICFNPQSEIRNSQSHKAYPLRPFFNPLFYLSIALFNIVITIVIGEHLLGSIDCFLLMPVVGAMIIKVHKTNIIL